MAKLMVIAGEASGDLHGGNVILELNKLRLGLKLFGTGGDLLETAGVKLLYRVDDLAVIGFTEVMKRYGYYKNIFQQMVSKLDEEKPEAVFLVDYAGFNLRFAAEAKKRGVKVIFYVAPQVWAWKKNRVHKIKKYVDELIVLFPFEVEFFKQFGIKAHCFGHPLLDIAKPSLTKEEFEQKWNLPKQTKRISLLPGSRRNEILKHLPLLTELAEYISQQQRDIQLLLPLAPTVSKSEILHFSQRIKAEIQIIEQDTYNAIAHSDFAVVASGTATLETAILQTPLLIYYKVSPLTYFIAKYILKIKAVGLPNIVAGKDIVPEFVQHLSSMQNISTAIFNFLDDQGKYEQIKQDLYALKRELGERGAYAKTAALINGLL
jgi:lipid-A-disaccharide synthase